MLEDNLEKGKRLEYATSAVLDKLNLSYKDCTEVYNFHSYEGNKHVPDFIIDDCLIEVKNWNCQNYYVNHVKVYNEIYKRWINFLDHKPILIISNPKWIKKEKVWLYSMGWRILELGYFVTRDNIDRAINDILLFFRELFGYVYTKYYSNYLEYLRDKDIGSLCKSMINIARKFKTRLKNRLKQYLILLRNRRLVRGYNIRSRNIPLVPHSLMVIPIGVNLVVYKRNPVGIGNSNFSNLVPEFASGNLGIGDWLRRSPLHACYV